MWSRLGANSDERTDVVVTAGSPRHLQKANLLSVQLRDRLWHEISHLLVDRWNISCMQSTVICVPKRVLWQVRSFSIFASLPDHDISLCDFSLQDLVELAVDLPWLVFLLLSTTADRGSQKSRKVRNST